MEVNSEHRARASDSESCWLSCGGHLRRVPSLSALIPMWLSTHRTNTYTLMECAHLCMKEITMCEKCLHIFSNAHTHIPYRHTRICSDFIPRRVSS